MKRFEEYSTKFHFLGSAVACGMAITGAILCLPFHLLWLSVGFIVVACIGWQWGKYATKRLVSEFTGEAVTKNGSLYAENLRLKVALGESNHFQLVQYREFRDALLEIVRRGREKWNENGTRELTEIAETALVNYIPLPESATRPKTGRPNE